MMGPLFCAVGLLVLSAGALAERALLTDAEAIHTETEAETQPALDKKLVRSVLGARIGQLMGVFVATWGWLQLVAPSYHLLRDRLSLSRTEASGLLLWLPLVLVCGFCAWAGHMLGQAHYQRFARHRVLGWLLQPFRLLAWPVQKLGELVVGSQPDFTEVGLRALSGSPDAFWQMVQDDSGRDMAPVNRQIFDKASELQSIRVRACMTFRTDIVAVEQEAGIEGLRQAFLSSGYSKIPVYRDDLDNVIGYCHSSGLFKKPDHIDDILSDILTVPESMTASQLLVELNQAQKSMAVVIDEYGGTSGVVTMEDVMEEIFGEIEDELDEQTETEQQENEHTWLLSARLEVDYLNEKYGWDLPTGDYESIGGLVVHLHQDLPEQGDTIDASPFMFEVVGMEETRITLLRLTFVA